MRFSIAFLQKRLYNKITKGLGDIMEFKDIIRTRRSALNLTLDDIGRHVGVSGATVSRWENGEIENIRRDKIAKLAEILQVTPAYLMGWEETIAQHEDKPIDDDLAIIQRERSKMTDKEKIKLMNILKANFDEYNWDADDSGDIE